MDDIPSDAQISQRLLTADDLLALEPDDESTFERFAAAAFERQSEISPTYRTFAGETAWEGWRFAPFLPVEAFKWDGIVPGQVEPDAVFLSSATGGRRSRHPIADLELCDKLAVAWFGRCVGRGPYRFIAHLPTYQQAGHESSLIHMVDTLMSEYGTPQSTFALDGQAVTRLLSEAGDHPSEHALLVFGTAFGLLELVETSKWQLPPGTLVIETGGMKSRRREIDRTTLHERLSTGFGLPRSSIRSEYGMCELVSQFYTTGDESFMVPPWVRVKIVDPDIPTREVDSGAVGLLAVFDLANINSVSAILTSDLARKTTGGVEIIGRVPGAELRGCNFLIDRSR